MPRDKIIIVVHRSKLKFQSHLFYHTILCHIFFIDFIKISQLKCSFMLAFLLFTFWSWKKEVFLMSHFRFSSFLHLEFAKVAGLTQFEKAGNYHQRAYSEQNWRLIAKLATVNNKWKSKRIEWRVIGPIWVLCLTGGPIIGTTWIPFFSDENCEFMVTYSWNRARMRLFIFSFVFFMTGK